MKVAVVFDCSGTLVDVKRIVKEIESQKFLCNHQTVDIVDRERGRALVIIGEHIPLLNLDSNMPMQELLEKIKWKITYCHPPIFKGNILKDRETKLKELQDPAYILSRFNIETDPGYALICDTLEGKVEYTIATGGCLFEGVEETVEELKNMGVEIYIASGDSKYAIEKLSKLIGIDRDHILPEAHQHLKRDLVLKLKRRGYKVVMVGDGTNDIPAMLESDLSVINLQGGKVSKKALDTADIKIENIGEIVEVVKSLK
ncbi:MAG TPA: HAD family hydrolase [Methanothermococcus okinawensis]|uniref:HAD family hydrolase n=1 Tax=Methanothermococcus okinawensis TaxID=155863 RepID=A0A832ZKA8_9EURY|nr:HAD family hydrolase [Methanococcaceae archaeon]HIP84666.1 HAD family hydrolase [Methanothermococcus okinawensis]HIP91726.1 HAD family hydrolase [Methanothermococcus okinawensis]